MPQGTVEVVCFLSSRSPHRPATLWSQHQGNNHHKGVAMTSGEQPRCTTGVVVISARRPSMRSLGGAANDPNATRLPGPRPENRNRSRLGPAIPPSHDVSETGTSDEASRSGSKNHPGLARGMTSLSPISAAASWPRRSRSLFHGHHTFHMPFRNQQALETVSAPHVPHGPGGFAFPCRASRLALDPPVGGAQQWHTSRQRRPRRPLTEGPVASASATDSN